jgi:hypothetical protein
MPMSQRSYERRLRQQREYRRANFARERVIKRAWFMKRAGLSLEDYAALCRQQGGVCGICGKPETSTFRGVLRSLCVDHDHATGVIRGLLCNRCNLMLCTNGSDLPRLKAALVYLERTGIHGAG